MRVLDWFPLPQEDDELDDKIKQEIRDSEARSRKTEYENRMLLMEAEREARGGGGK